MPWQILVKQSKTADVTSGGLFMPADSTEKPSEGTVVLAGPGTTHPETGKMIPNPCKEGDLVLLSEYVGEKVDYCGDKHSFVSASEVLGIFEGGAPVVGNFKPLQDRVLVKLTESATETASGIALASETTEEPTQGEVLAVGEGLITSQAPPPPPPPPPPHHRHLQQQHHTSTSNSSSANPPHHTSGTRTISPTTSTTAAAPQQPHHGREHPTLLLQGDVVPPGVKPGDSVIYGKYTGTMVNIGGEEYKVVPASDCLAKW